MRYMSISHFLRVYCAGDNWISINMSLLRALESSTLCILDAGISFPLLQDCCSYPHLSKHEENYFSCFNRKIRPHCWKSNKSTWMYEKGFLMVQPSETPPAHMCATLNLLCLIVFVRFRSPQSDIYTHLLWLAAFAEMKKKLGFELLSLYLLFTFHVNNQMHCSECVPAETVWMRVLLSLYFPVSDGWLFTAFRCGCRLAIWYYF